MAAPIRGGAHFESLGAPVKRLLAKLKGQVSEEDMALLSEFISVKDMAKIFDSLGTDRTAEDIWEELRAALLSRKEKQKSKLTEREAAVNALKDEQAAEEAEEERLRREAEERKLKKAEKKARKEAEAAAAEEEEVRKRLAAEAEEAERLEAERLAEEEAAEEERKRKKAEKKRKLKEEEERLAAEKAAKKHNQAQEWEDFVANHPLQYSESAGPEIVQKSRTNDNEDGLAPRPTLAASADLLNRTWTPYCPHCLAKDDMELLTDSGFIDYKEARRRYGTGGPDNTLIVAGYDQNARSLVYEKPTAFIDKDGAPADGMYEINERVHPVLDQGPRRMGYSIKVTGEHQLLIEVDNDTPWGHKTVGNRARVFGLGPLKPTVKQILGADLQPNGKKWPAGLKADAAYSKPRLELQDDDSLYLMAAAVKGLEGGGKLRDFIPIADLAPAWADAIEDKRQHKGKRPRNHLVDKIQLEQDMGELLGFWLGDGSVHVHADVGTGSAVIFCQTKDTDVEYLDERLERIGLELRRDYTFNHYDATPTSRELNYYHITNTSWRNFIFGEFACKYANGLKAATYLGVEAAATAAWRREHNCEPPTPKQIKDRKFDFVQDDDIIDIFVQDDDIIDIDADNNMPALGTPSMGQKSKVAAKKNTTTTTTTTITIIKSAKWFWPWVWCLGPRHCLSILFGLMEADGYGSFDNENYSNVVWTSSVAFRDQLVRLAFHAGRNGMYDLIYKAGTNRGTAKNGKDIIARHDHWAVRIAKPTGAACPTFSRSDIKEVDGYNQGVWCVTMPHGNIVVRRRHKDPTESYRPVVIGNCHAKYSKPPPEWDCSMCLRKFRQHVKCWQPDDKADNCAICKRGIGRFTRHHCRNCGRVVCGPCSDYNAKITSVGYTSPVRVCRQCVDELGTVQQAGK